MTAFTSQSLFFVVDTVLMSNQTVLNGHFVDGIFPDVPRRHFSDEQFPDGQFPERTVPRKDISPNHYFIQE